MTILFNIIIVMFFVLLNAFFVVAEFSMVKVRKSQISMLAADGRPAARYAKLVTDDLNSYLSACQLGITLASLALGWFQNDWALAIRFGFIRRSGTRHFCSSRLCHHHHAAYRAG